jgi:hypothetical protein
MPEEKFLRKSFFNKLCVEALSNGDAFWIGGQANHGSIDDEISLSRCRFAFCGEV